MCSDATLATPEACQSQDVPVLDDEPYVIQRIAIRSFFLRAVVTLGPAMADGSLSQTQTFPLGRGTPVTSLVEWHRLKEDWEWVLMGSLAFWSLIPTAEAVCSRKSLNQTIAACRICPIIAMPPTDAPRNSDIIDVVAQLDMQSDVQLNSDPAPGRLSAAVTYNATASQPVCLIQCAMSTLHQSKVYIHLSMYLQWAQRSVA